LKIPPAAAKATLIRALATFIESLNIKRCTG